MIGQPADGGIGVWYHAARVSCNGKDDERGRGAVSCAAGLCTALPSSAKSVT